MPDAILRAANWPMLVTAAIVTAVAFAAAGLMRLSRDGGRLLQRMNGSDGAFVRALISLAAVYFFIYSYLSVQRYYKFLCGSSDLAVFESLFGNALAGRFFQDYRGAFGHLDLSLAVYLPFYALWRDARTLLILQTAALTLAVWPLYLLAREAGAKASPAAALGIAYLLYPLVTSGNLDDFHEVSLSPVLFFAMLLFMVRAQWKRYFAAMLFLLAVKETEAVLVLGAGLYLLSQKKWKVGAVTTTAAAAWAVLALTVVLPSISGEGITAAPLQRFLDVPGRLRSAEQFAGVLAIFIFVMAPIGFLAARRARPFIFILGPAFAASIASSIRSQNVLLGHYGLTVSAAALGAAALALGGAGGFDHDEKPSRMPLFLIIVAALSNIAFSYPAHCRNACPQERFLLARSFNIMSLPPPVDLMRTGFYRSAPHQELLHAAVDFFPEGSSVAAQNNVGYIFLKRCRLKDLSSDVQADFYIFAPEMYDGFTGREVYWGLYRRLVADEDVRLLLSINVVAGRRPEFVLFAAGNKGDAFYRNAREALAREPSNPSYALVVRKLRRQMEEPGDSQARR